MITITPPMPTVASRSEISVFDEHESSVRSYVRDWPTVFDTATGTRLYDTDGRSYLDFFAGAGALNYGHNHPDLKRALLDYIARDGVTHSLDMATSAKSAFITTLHEKILAPRGLDYKALFPGPTGTNAVEAALKIARLSTGRREVVHFTNSFHGMSLGSLSVTSNPVKRDGAGVPLTDSRRVPFNDSGAVTSLPSVLDAVSTTPSKPAAIIVETVQGEGGINVASDLWLRELREFCTVNGVVMIVDDIQMGCGRTGSFFSFESAEIAPDIVTLSKSISGYGLPMALVLLKPELDVFSPGQHNGTFRGNNPAFVTATAAINQFWSNAHFAEEVSRKGDRLIRGMRQALSSQSIVREVRGKGLALGFELTDGQTAARVVRASFEAGLLAETCGTHGHVVKLLPPLTVTDQEIDEGLEIVCGAIADAAERQGDPHT